MKLLSFDQASKITGYSCFIDGDWQYSRIINKDKKDLDTDRRFNEMVLAIYEVIDKEQPDAIALEGVALQSNAKTMSLLARLQGAIVGKALEMSISYSIIEPARWRKTVGIQQGKKKREELKKDSLKLAHEWLSKSLSEDASESCLLGCAYLIINGYKTLSGFQEDIW